MIDLAKYDDPRLEDCICFAICEGNIGDFRTHFEPMVYRRRMNWNLWPSYLVAGLFDYLQETVNYRKRDWKGPDDFPGVLLRLAIRRAGSTEWFDGPVIMRYGQPNSAHGDLFNFMVAALDAIRAECRSFIEDQANFVGKTFDDPDVALFGSAPLNLRSEAFEINGSRSDRSVDDGGGN